MAAGMFSDDIGRALGGLAGEVAQAFGEELIGIYLEGSFAWGDPVETSDLDLRVVTRRAPVAAMKAALSAAAARAQESLGREVGARIDPLPDLKRIGAVRFQRARLIDGRDVRAEVPLKPIDAFVADSLLGAHDLIVSARTDVGQPATQPIGAPRPGAEFRGYDSRPVLDRGRWVPSSKRLVSNVTAIATALVARRTRTHVYAKGEVAGLYQRLVGDDWAPFILAVHEECRVRAAYRLPAGPEARGRLSAYCDRALTFENMLLSISVPYLVGLREGGDPAQQAMARRRLGRMSL